MTNFYDEEGNKAIVEINDIKRVLLKQPAVVTVEANVLDQNDLRVFWKMVHLSFTRILQTKQHIQCPYSNQDLIHTYLLMNEREVNFAYVVVDWLLDKVKNFNLPAFHHLSRERNKHMPYASHLTRIFKHFGVSFEGYEVQ